MKNAIFAQLLVLVAALNAWLIGPEAGIWAALSAIAYAILATRDSP